MVRPCCEDAATYLTADVLHNFVGCILRCLWLLRHLDLLIDKMNQKSSFIQILKSVQRLLTSDTKLASGRLLRQYISLQGVKHSLLGCLGNLACKLFVLLGFQGTIFHRLSRIFHISLQISLIAGNSRPKLRLDSS